MIQKLLENQNINGLNMKELTKSLVLALGKRLKMPTKNSILICLDLALTAGDDRVLDYRKQVISQVRNLLDDRKRSTRRLAVKCVNDWSLV